jgi:hypothetical protein
VDRDALIKLAASAMSVDPDTLDHMSEKELIGTLEDLGVDPGEYYDKSKLIEKLTKGRGLKKLLELFEVLGVDVSDIMDMDKLLALGAKLGPPVDGEADGEEGDEGVDEATKPKPKIGDPDWVPSAKQELQPNDPVKALQKLRNDARAEWFPGGIVDEPCVLCLRLRAVWWQRQLPLQPRNDRRCQTYL